MSPVAASVAPVISPEALIVVAPAIEPMLVIPLLCPSSAPPSCGVVSSTIFASIPASTKV